MTPFGDHAVRFEVPSALSARRSLLDRLRRLPGVRDVIFAESVGCVVFTRDANRAVVAEALTEPDDVTALAPAAEHRVRVVYDGADLEAVATTLGRARADVIALHAGAEYRVAMLGFLPGFAYLRGLPAELRLPRRAPRPRVPARSVAIGAEYTGIYPVASAGGWHLLGRALDTPRLAVGDGVRFVVSEADEPALTSDAASGDEAVGAASPRLVLTQVAGLALFVDGGRPGQMHEGMPPGGPLVREAFARANARAGNAAGACAIEISGRVEVEARGGAIALADRVLGEGDRLAIASGSLRATYLAVRGGFDAPVVRGSRGALLAAGIGRPLRRGDLLSVGADAASPAVPHDDPTPTAATGIVLRPGPDATPEVMRVLCSAEYQISPSSDRAGTRLVGAAPRLEAGTRPSTPMVEGAIELTPSGLVVLGPDHPTTGGYPVVAVVASGSRDAFFAHPLGARLRFRA